jgi:ATP-dependent helicase HrpB
MGRGMARMGTHPRLARMLLAAADEGEKALAADLAALLEERDPIRDRDAPADINARLELLHGADHPNADRATIQRIRRAAALHRRRLRLHGTALPGGEAGPLLAAGFPDRIAAKRGTMDGAFRLAGLGVAGAAGGQGARLAANDPLGRAPLLAVADLELQGTEARIRMAAPLDLATLEARFPDRLRWEESAAFDARAGAVLARRRRMFGPLVLEEHALPAPDPATIAAALAVAIAERGLRDLNWTEAAKQTRARLRWMAGVEEGWPDMSDAALAAGVQDWLAPHLHGCAKLAEAKALDVVAILRNRLPWEQQRRLDAALPARIDLPGGRSAMVDYDRDVPTLEARAQHLFGLDVLPKLAEGRVALRAALLSPAGRPIAVTGDLHDFWRGGWLDARKDMRGRYPKHAWPEEPWRAD